MAMPVTKEHRPQYRVLLVEDHAPLAEATAEFMRREGLNVQCASTGREALEISATFQPEIVLCDMHLPDMPGLDVARALRAISSAKDAVIAIHTAMTKSEIRTFVDQQVDAAVNLFLTKPITIEKVHALITALRSHSPKTLIL
jgi:DNA-binding response OmpR family regulator